MFILSSPFGVEREYALGSVHAAIATTASSQSVTSCEVELELQLVADRDAEFTGGGYRWLEACAAAIDGARMEPHEVEAAALVEAERIEVVVGRDQPQAPGVAASSDALGLGEERAADALPAIDGVEREDLHLIPMLDEGRDARELAIKLGNQRFVEPRVDQLAETSHEARVVRLEERVNDDTIVGGRDPDDGA
jgi:hypothetical protein